MLILRWFWWRVNAWSELTAMVVPRIVLGFLRSQTTIGFPDNLYLIVGITTAAWLVTTDATPAVDTATLISFYRRVRPGGPGWKPIAVHCPELRPDAGFGWLFVDWIAGVALVYAVLFAVGSVIFGEWMQAVALAVLAAICAVLAATCRDRPNGTLARCRRTLRIRSQRPWWPKPHPSASNTRLPEVRRSSTAVRKLECAPVSFRSAARWTPVAQVATLAAS